MANKATKDQKEQVKTLSYINSMITILGDYPESNLPLSMETNPFGFLIEICKSLGIFDELLLFLTKFIQYEVPLMEGTVKTILLSKLKETISCSSNPYIPNYLRKQIDSNTTSGITFTISELDYTNLLQTNPLANGSEYLYLGVPRKYYASFSALQNRDRQLVTSVTKTFVNKETFILSDKGDEILHNTIVDTTNKQNAWIDKNIKKLKSKKHSFHDKGQYYVVDESSEPIVEEISGTPITRLTSIIHSINEYFIPSSGNNLNETSCFDTYIEAEQYLTSLKNKYKKDYSERNGYTIQTKIISKVDIGVNELSRAKDFDAFLWYLIHTTLGKPITLNATSYINNKTFDSINQSLSKYNCGNASGNITNELRFTQYISKTKQKTTSLLGRLFNFQAKEDGNIKNPITLLCVKQESTYQYDSEQNIISENIEYILRPLTCDDKSINWYGNRKNYFDYLKFYGSTKKEELNSKRNYSKDIGICNLAFDTTINDTSEYTNFNRNQLRFTVLPKPLIQFSKFLEDGTEIPISLPKKITFNENGELDSDGHYSMSVLINTNTQRPEVTKNTKYRKGGITNDFTNYYKIITPSDKSVIGRLYLTYDSKNILFTNNPNKESDIKQINPPLEALYECYPNLTIYEFDYDYIMSQRLFDPKVIVGELISSILNVKLGLNSNLSINKNTIEGSLRQVIIDMITGETESYVANDCFSKFSNDKYDNLLKETELKKSQHYHFGNTDRTISLNTEEIEKILNEYDNPNITQEGQVDILKRTFQQAMVTITDATDDTEVWDIKFNFIHKLIMELVFSIVKSILTPKILMILMVNQKLVDDNSGNDKNQGNVFEVISQLLLKIFNSLVKEISQQMIQQLTDFVMDYLKPKFQELGALLLKEYTEQYRTQLATLISACGFGWGSSVATADTQIDKVTYADIDPIKQLINDKQC